MLPTMVCLSSQWIFVFGTTCTWISRMIITIYVWWDNLAAIIRSSKRLPFFSQLESATNWSKDSPLANGTHLNSSLMFIQCFVINLDNWLGVHLNSRLRVALVRGQSASRRSWRTFKSLSPEGKKGFHLLCSTFSSIMSCCASLLCSLLLQVGSVPQQNLHMSYVTMRALCPRCKVHGRFFSGEEKQKRVWTVLYQSTWNSSIRPTDPDQSALPSPLSQHFVPRSEVPCCHCTQCYPILHPPVTWYSMKFRTIDAPEAGSWERQGYQLQLQGEVVSLPHCWSPPGQLLHPQEADPPQGVHQGRHSEAGCCHCHLSLGERTHLASGGTPPFPFCFVAPPGEEPSRFVCPST